MHIRPMLAEIAEKPFDSERHIFEFKYDGVRCIATPDNLWGREGKTLSQRFPEIQIKTFIPAILDGEIVCLNSRGIPEFNLIQHRVHQSDPFKIKHLARLYPAIYIAFDCLNYGGNDISRLKLKDRKQALENMRDSSFVIAEYFMNNDLFKKAVELGYEGIMAKELSSPYLPGKRSSYWLKIKRQLSGEFLAFGLTVGEGERANTFGSLILAESINGTYRWVGNVGSGFDRKSLLMFREMASEIKRKEPLILYQADMGKALFWCEPFPIRVVYMERTGEGHLRFPRLERC